MSVLKRTDPRYVRKCTKSIVAIVRRRMGEYDESMARALLRGWGVTGKGVDEAIVHAKEELGIS